MTQQSKDHTALRLQQAGLLTAVPFVLLVGPALGYVLGSAADRRWSWAPWGMLAGIVLGLLASARVTIQLIRQAQQLYPAPQKPHSEGREGE